MAKDFHSRCDYKGATITLIKVKKTGKRCGGYTSISWKSLDEFAKDPSAFLFSLDLKSHYPVQQNQYAVYLNRKFGP